MIEVLYTYEKDFASRIHWSNKIVLKSFRLLDRGKKQNQNFWWDIFKESDLQGIAMDPSIVAGYWYIDLYRPKDQPIYQNQSIQIQNQNHRSQPTKKSN